MAVILSDELAMHGLRQAARYSIARLKGRSKRQPYTPILLLPIPASLRLRHRNSCLIDTPHLSKYCIFSSLSYPFNSFVFHKQMRGGIVCIYALRMDHFLWDVCMQRQLKKLRRCHGYLSPARSYTFCNLPSFFTSFTLSFLLPLAVE